jgi:hypothetical protein
MTGLGRHHGVVVVAVGSSIAAGIPGVVAAFAETPAPCSKLKERFGLARDLER